MSFLRRLFGKKRKSTSQQTNTEPKTHVKENTAQDKARQYHVSLNKDKKSRYYKKWRVRLEKSEKTIKYFDTQKQAIEYAETLAKEYKTTVVIHKVDGSIRKQDYSS